MLQQQELMRCVQMVGADANLRHQANIRQTETHRRRREKHEQSHCQDEERVQMHTTLQPAVYIANWHPLWPKMQATSRQEKSSEQSASNMAARTLQMHMRLAVAKKSDLCCKFVMVAPVDGTIISMAYYVTRIL